MPLPFALDHINLWLLRDQIDGREGWTVVDCGVSRDEVKALWEQVFEQALDGLPVLRVIVTHMHPDHVGLAHWLCERWHAPLCMTMTDFAFARLWSRPAVNGVNAGGPNGQSAVDHFTRHGLSDPEAQDKIRQRSNYYPSLVPDVPSRFNRIMDGDRIQIGGRKWRVIVGYGHAPEHASLYCDTLQVLISGDMVLPRISTNISVFDFEPDANPLPLYLNSLRAYDGLPEDTLVLPSHGRPFRGLHERIAQQNAHHAERLEEVMTACVRPMSTTDIVPIMFRRKLDLHQLTFAMGEALAHLHALYFDGKLARSTGDDGVVRFVRK
jgi:glyoxylase-like metal-dependent hydrolase (beta-lactamase superfamily II)